MNKHNCYVEINADDNFSLGFQLGTLFKANIQDTLCAKQKDKKWKLLTESANKLLTPTLATFPQYVDELKCQAKGAEVEFKDLWTLFVSGEISLPQKEKCTSIVLNKGQLCGGTEDCYKEVMNDLYILRKKIKNLEIIELYYTYSLGGDSISVNSNGFCQMTNTLTHTDHQIGIPRNVIGRWLSETKDPKSDFAKLQKLNRSSGYSHTIVSKNKGCFNIELTAKKQKLTAIDTPFVHTNHYLTDLEQLQDPDFSTGMCLGSIERYNSAKSLIKNELEEQELINILGNTDNGSQTSIFNERTIGKMIVNFETNVVKIWMLREAEKGWVEYKIPSHC